MDLDPASTPDIMTGQPLHDRSCFGKRGTNMKYSDLKAWHANVVMAIILLITWIVEKNGVFFTLACCFIALAFAGKIKEDQKAEAARQEAEAITEETAAPLREEITQEDTEPLILEESLPDNEDE